VYSTVTVTPGTAFANGEYEVWTIPSGDYTVTATKVSGTSNAVISGVFFGGGSAPTIPGGLAASSNNAAVNLTWTASTKTGAVNGPVSYRIKRSTVGASGPFTDIKTGVSVIGSPSYNDTTVTNGDTYWYVVSGYQGGTESANSTAVEAMPIAVTKATLVTTDTTTLGNWQQNYGDQGYDMEANGSNVPVGGASVALLNASSYTFLSSTTATNALYNAAATNRVEAVWYSSTAETFTVTPSASSPEVALYLDDYNNGGNPRSETVTVEDAASNAVLVGPTTVSAFTGGEYLVYNITGPVKFVVTKTAGANAIVSGIFFGPAATASYISTDSVTTANITVGSPNGWRSLYGSAGYDIANSASAVAAAGYLSGLPTLTGGTFYVYSPSLDDNTQPYSVIPAAASATSASSGVDATWYVGGGGSETFNVVTKTIPVPQVTHEVSIYVMDPSNVAVIDTINILDANTGNVLATQASDTLGSLGATHGEFINFHFTGHVKIQVVNTQGINAVVSALFFE